MGRGTSIKKMKNKKGGFLQETTIEIILIALIFVLFIFGTAGKTDTRGVHQQIIEKQLALMIDSAVPGMEFNIPKLTRHGIVDNIEIKEGAIYVAVDGFGSLDGYPIFTKYQLETDQEKDGSYTVRVT